MPDETKPADTPAASPPAQPAPAYPDPVETKHSIKVNRRTLNYKVNVGTLPIVNKDTGETEAHIFYMAYTLETDAPDRPLLFAFNGGPGSSSVWLHLGMIAPRRVQLLDDGSMPAPPFKLIDNPETWLEFADLVFVDPVGTGYSRAVKPELNQKFWGVNGDLESMSEFIRLYLTRSGRWGSPLFLAGESYGTTRAAGLAGKLIDQGIAFNGILLISTVINFQSLEFNQQNDLPSLVFLPTYAATAWYHKRLAADLQAKPLREFLNEVETWIEGEYNTALLKGSALPQARRRAVASKLARYTGLSRQYVELSNLRIDIHRFCKELLRDQQRTVGRLDSRLAGTVGDAVSEVPEFDPSYAAIMPPFTTMINRYLGQELGYKTDMEYRILHFGVFEKWDWGSGRDGYPDTSQLLRGALTKNPYLKVLLAQGYYDMATPYYAAYYTVNHMGIGGEIHDRIRTAEYEAGHMMYIEKQSLSKMKQDIGDFIKFAL